MALDMAIKAVIAIAQKGFGQDAYHEIMRATARKNIITFTAALLKTGCTGDKGEGILPNMKFDEITVEHYNALVFVSGGGAAAYQKNPLALKLVKEFYDKGKVVAALGDALPILANAGVLSGKIVACDDAEKEVLSNAAFSTENLFADGRIITAKGGFAKDFGEKLSDVLVEIGIQKLGRGIEL